MCVGALAGNEQRTLRPQLLHRGRVHTNTVLGHVQQFEDVRVGAGQQLQRPSQAVVDGVVALVGNQCRWRRQRDEVGRRLCEDTADVGVALGIAGAIGTAAGDALEEDAVAVCAGEKL